MVINMTFNDKWQQRMLELTQIVDSSIRVANSSTIQRGAYVQIKSILKTRDGTIGRVIETFFDEAFMKWSVLVRCIGGGELIVSMENVTRVTIKPMLSVVKP
jgi:hypothetical protein